MNIKFFQKLIERYLDGKTTADELKLLVNYYESFQKENEWVEVLGPENYIKERMLVNILEAIKTDDTSQETKTIHLFSSTLLKYTVAASIVALLGFFVFNQVSEPQIDQPGNVVSSSIEAGKSGAILTVEDGSTISLENGTEYISGNKSSNGKELVYSASSTPANDKTYNYLTIPRGRQFFVKLSDGTQVWLNSESKLKYPTSFLSGEIRTVELIYGEAYFDVSPSSEHNGDGFTVIHKLQNLEVLGTEFNIKAYKGDNKVFSTLIEGKVEIFNTTTELILKPGQQSIIENGKEGIQVVNADIFSVTAWKKGVFSFKNMELVNIMKVLSRWYDADVSFLNEDVEKVKFTGVLGKEQNIEEILSVICDANQIKYEISDNQITFK